jgi:hypothetical protein
MLAATAMLAWFRVTNRRHGLRSDRAVVPNAKVVITNIATNQPQTLSTSGTGDWS